MVDLDASEATVDSGIISSSSSNSSLATILPLVFLLKGQIEIKDHDIITKWLGIHRYILPDNRKISPAIWDIPIMKPRTSTGCYKMGLIAWIAEVQYSEKQQIEAIKFTVDKTPKVP